MDLIKYKNFAIKTAKSSGDILMSYFDSAFEVKKKSSVDLVTKADIESEKNIINSIKENFPNHGVIAEESDLINQNSDLFATLISSTQVPCNRYIFYQLRSVSY